MKRFKLKKSSHENQCITKEWRTISFRMAMEIFLRELHINTHLARLNYGRALLRVEEEVIVNPDDICFLCL